MRASSCRSAPAAALRGFTNSRSPFSRCAAFIASKSRLSMSTSPRTSISAGGRLAGELERDRADRAQVRGHVFARRSRRRASRRATSTPSSYVRLIASPSNLGSAAYSTRSAPERPRARAGRTPPTSSSVERVAEREHRHAVRAPAPNCGLRLRADALRRRIRRDELGILRFERLELAKQRVVLRVGDERRVERVVLVVVPLDLLAQRCQRARRASRGTRHENRRSARSLPGGMPRASILAWMALQLLLDRAARSLSFSGTRLSSTSVPPSPCASSTPIAQHELERGVAVGDARHVEQQRHAARREMLDLLGQERRGLVIVEREERLLRARRVVEHAVRLELEAGALGKRCGCACPRTCAPARDDVDADRHVDVGAERVELARGRERRLDVGAASRSRREALGALLRGRAERRERAEIDGALAVHELQRERAGARSARRSTAPPPPTRRAAQLKPATRKRRPPPPPACAARRARRR